MKEYVEQIEEAQKTTVLTDFVGVIYDDSLAILVRTGVARWQWIGCAANTGYFSDKTFVSILDAVAHIKQDECEFLAVHIYVFGTKKEQFEWALSRM